MSDVYEVEARRDRRPLPLQVRDMLLETIRSEGWRPGDQLPAEPVLSERFGVGRSTLREAMKLLERDGLIEVLHGRGSFVSAMADLSGERPITRFESVTEMMQGLGYTIENRVLSVRERAATKEERAALELEGSGSGAPRVIELERLRLHDGEPFIYSVNVLDRSLFDEPPDELDWSGSVIAMLDARGQRVVSSAAHIRAVPAPEAVADGGAGPWLLITETCVTATGRSVLQARDYHRGDVFVFHVVRRRPPGD